MAMIRCIAATARVLLSQEGHVSGWWRLHATWTECMRCEKIKLYMA